MTTTPQAIIGNVTDTSTAANNDPVESVCLNCKKPFTTHRLQLMGKNIIPSLCGPCAEARDTRLPEWAALCPREFRTHDEGGNTIPARMDKDSPALADTQRYAAQRAGDYNDRLAAEVELLKKRKELEEASKQLAHERNDQLVAKQVSQHIDSLASMGGFASAASIQNQTLDVQRRQLEKLGEIHTAIKAGSHSIHEP